MFGLRKSERQAYEGHIETLREEIHWLRSCIPWAVAQGSATPAARVLGSGTLPPIVQDEQDDQLPLVADPLRPMSDEEEDVYDAYQRGELDKEEAKAMLAVLGIEPESIDFK